MCGYSHTTTVIMNMSTTSRSQAPCSNTLAPLIGTITQTGQVRKYESDFFKAFKPLMMGGSLRASQIAASSNIRIGMSVTTVAGMPKCRKSKVNAQTMCQGTQQNSDSNCKTSMSGKLRINGGKRLKIKIY
jgi:hypothetical protein